MEIPQYLGRFIHGILLLLIIGQGANYLIQHAMLSLPRQKASHAAPQGPPANEAAFSSALEAGTKAFNEGHYTDALDRFLDAEHTAVQLSVD